MNSLSGLMELCMREQTTNLICWMCQVYPRGLKKEIKYCSDSRTNVHVLNYPLIRLYLPTLSLPQSIVLYCFFNTNWFSGKCLCKVKALVMIKGLNCGHRGFVFYKPLDLFQIKRGIVFESTVSMEMKGQDVHCTGTGDLWTWTACLGCCRYNYTTERPN